MKKRLSILFSVAIVLIIAISGLQAATYAIPYCWEVCEDPGTPLEQACHCINWYTLDCFAYLNGWCPFG